VTDNRLDMTIGQDDSGSQYLNIQPLSRNILMEMWMQFLCQFLLTCLTFGATLTGNLTSMETTHEKNKNNR